mmetsp:Transcript_35469/g.82303  ORF Transcript_35469/g.82303 Transcript_35469/m.82303 type:complete len:122 (+) Transcript_35469:4603-4968(+)
MCTTERITNQCYVKLRKALYSCLKSALLFYKKLVPDIKSIGFNLNPYDPCVANKVVNGKQLTIFWHVDGIKISYISKYMVTWMLNWLEGKYDKMSATRWKLHNYLGMDLDFCRAGSVNWDD